jgi:predicted enzyme related to lactoylglutathione lyase
LGLEFAFGDEKFVAFKLGDALLGIKISEYEREIPGHQTIILDVENVWELYESSRNKGIKIYKELSSEDWGDNFAILDPDGNKIEFTQK